MPHCHCFWSNIIQETCPLVHLTVIDFLRISSPTPPSAPYTHSVQGGNPRQLRCPHPKGPQRHHTSRASSPAHDPPQFRHQTGRDRVATAETSHSHTGQCFLQATGLPGHFLSFLKSVQYIPFLVLKVTDQFLLLTKNLADTSTHYVPGPVSKQFHFNPHSNLREPSLTPFCI